jgi:murein DD-endopeptidase MepM/ murein hydrolase activator NlpD
VRPSLILPPSWLRLAGRFILVAFLGLIAVLPAAPGATAPARNIVPAGPSPTDPRPAPSQAGPDARYFAETGHTLARGFRDYWETERGATLLGLPLTDEFVEHYTDGSSQTVQYFERGVLEYHPERAPGHQIAVRALGPLLLAGRHFDPSSGASGQAFPTGFAVSGEFLRFWRDMNGAEAFGNPLSPPVIEDGRTVQYFERARFEAHPEFIGTPYGVALAPAGYAALRAAGYSLPLGALVRIEPPVLAEGHTLLVRVAVPAGGTVSGKLDDQSLAFVRPPPGTLAGQPLEERHAVAGVAALGAVGAHRLTLTLTDAQGRSRTVTRTVQVEAWSFPTERLTLDPEDTSLLAPATVNAELKQINALFAGRNGGPLWSGTFRAPLAGTLTVTAPFGQRRAYNDGPVDSFHAGLDLRAARGTPVLAAAAGRVVLATRLQVRGNCIILDHGMGVYTMYAHLSAFRVAKGATVRAGQVLGLSGNTGLSTAAHLHWEMHVSGPAVSALEWTQRVLP